MTLSGLVVMRDDLHKNAPVSNAWKDVIKRLIRDADYRQTGKAAIEKAIVDDLRNELGTRPVRELKDRLAQNDLVGIGHIIENVREHSTPSALRDAILDELDYSVSNGGMSRQQLQAAISAGMHSQIEAHKRNIVGHVYNQSPKDAPEMRRRLDEAVASVELDSLIEPMLNGEAPQSDGVDLGLDLDANLLGDNW